MIEPISQSECKRARAYYYDYICEENGEPIPAEIVAHIGECEHCKAATDKLKFELFQSAVDVNQGAGKLNSALIANLKLHFAYIDKPVSCDIAKPFLPTLLDQALRVRIPTPIVAHVFNCQQCSEDLDTIRCLKLSRKQLYRLSHLFVNKPAGSNISCAEARCAIPSFISMIFSEIDSEVLKHLCTCPVCRRLVYKERQKLCDSLPENVPSPEFSCETVSTGDFFDYVVPHEIDPANEQDVQSRKSFVSHVITCPDCLARMQQLHETLYYIDERAESKVVTVYRIDESAMTEVPCGSDDIYAGFPIRIETANREDRVNAWAPASAIRLGTILKKKASTVNLTSFIKTSIAAAAVLVALVLFFHAPTAKAITIDQIYKAISNIKNVYIAKFTPDSTEPQQELWVSKTIQFYMNKFGNRIVLWDARNGFKKTKDLSTGAAEMSSLTEDTIAGIDRRISGHLGLVPFTNMSEIPANAEWKQITDKGPEITTEDIEIYDLIWTTKTSDGSDILRKWRVFVDPKTNLPQKTKFYEKLPFDSELLLQSVNVVEYLDNSEIQTIIKEVSF